MIKGERGELAHARSTAGTMCCRPWRGGPGRGSTAEVQCPSSYGSAVVRRARGEREGARRGEAGDGAVTAQGASSTRQPSGGTTARRAAVQYGGARRPQTRAGQRAGLTGGQTACHPRVSRSDRPTGPVRPPGAGSQEEKEGGGGKGKGEGLREREKRFRGGWLRNF